MYVTLLTQSKKLPEGGFDVSLIPGVKAHHRHKDFQSPFSNGPCWSRAIIGNLGQRINHSLVRAGYRTIELFLLSVGSIDPLSMGIRIKT